MIGLEDYPQFRDSLGDLYSTKSGSEIHYQFAYPGAFDWSVSYANIRDVFTPNEPKRVELIVPFSFYISKIPH